METAVEPFERSKYHIAMTVRQPVWRVVRAVGTCAQHYVILSYVEEVLSFSDQTEETIYHFCSFLIVRSAGRHVGFRHSKHAGV